MHVADRDRKSVGGVVRRRYFSQTQQQLDHVLHLRLFRAAVADDGALDLGGCVFEDRHARLDGRKHRDAAGMAELQRAAHVDRVKQVLDRGTVRAALVEDDGQPAVNQEQLVGKRRERRTLDGAADDNPVARPVGLDAAVTGALTAGVDAEHSHASEASISFSEMSKFDQTCCTSSWSSSASISFSIDCATLPSSLT